MVGAPGIGKTLVALNLIRDQDYSEKRFVISRRLVGGPRPRIPSSVALCRRSFFLVTTRALAEQQHQRLQTLSDLNVVLCVGREMDLLTKDQVRDGDSRP
jgi:superfamily II DNA or RNA helicase